MQDDPVVPKLPKSRAEKGGQDAELRSDLADFVLLALKAATHHMLYLRKAYPDRYFSDERVLGTSTKACRHAAVRQYISEVLDSIKGALLAGTLRTFCVVLHQEGLPAHEALCLQPHLLLPSAASQQASTNANSSAMAVDWDAASEALRAALLHVHRLPHLLPPPVKDSLWQVRVQVDMSKELPSQLWAASSDPRQWRTPDAVAAAHAPAVSGSQGSKQAQQSRSGVQQGARLLASSDSQQAVAGHSQSSDAQHTQAQPPQQHAKTPTQTATQDPAAAESALAALHERAQGTPAVLEASPAATVLGTASDQREPGSAQPSAADLGVQQLLGMMQLRPLCDIHSASLLALRASVLFLPTEAGVD